MDNSEQPKRRAKRITDRNAPSKPSRAQADYRTLNLDLVTHAGLETAAKKRGISARKFAAAAINYFVEASLDPTQPRVNYLDGLGVKMSEVQQDIRQHNAGIGNRLVEIMRAWERQLYNQLTLIQASHIQHLEAVEANVLRHLLLLQQQALAPMFEELLRYGIDANLARIMSERIFLHLHGEGKEKWRAQQDVLDKVRDTQLTQVLQQLLAKYSPPASQKSTSPPLTPPPQPAARKPTPSATPGATPASTTPT